MSTEILIPLDEANPPSPALLPASPAARLHAAEHPDAPPTPGERLAYLFRRCQAHPLRQVLADHRGVHE
ncbi:MAG: hypothetical protein JZU58_00775 [Curvibacter lanceolatus]|uniref:hypothetical protein n=1 Tax=Curvibacter lanceolatus TaxID=86182 RepID=UPI00039AA868|nr:hypothetical protein [Curvibacter lanceolatus]MBV5290853.1 hypothetical protein [Curvibacter lanceolatus]